MIKGSKRRTTAYPVHPIFLNRWSPRAMSGDLIKESELLALFEAARWAPSSYNNQPWRILYALRNTENWYLFFDLLADANKVWAHNAAALLVFVSKTTFDHNNKPSITHSFDTGAAWQNLALQGSLNGYVIHGMQGFDYARTRLNLLIPADFHIEAMVAIGQPGNLTVLPEELQKKEFPNDRRPLTEIVCEGRFSFEYTHHTPLL